MKANELRIGNYVNVLREDQSPFKIDGFELLNESDCKVFKDNGTYNCPPFGEIKMHPLTWNLKDLQPIPLTEEWLLRFGFEKSRLGYFTVFCGNNVMSVCCFDDFSRVQIVTQTVSTINHVHQLQNLYFALTGEELTLKTEL